MSDLLNDIVERIDVKPNNYKAVIKHTISIAIVIIGIAFVLGEIKTNVINKIDNIDTGVSNNTKALIDLSKSIQDQRSQDNMNAVFMRLYIENLNSNKKK